MSIKERLDWIYNWLIDYKSKKSLKTKKGCT